MSIDEQPSETRKEASSHVPIARESLDVVSADSSEAHLQEVSRGELWMGHFQQLTTLTIGGGAGLLVLLEVGAAVESGLPFYVSLVSFGVGLILCLGGQAKILDDDGSNPAMWRDLREIRRGAFLALFVAFVAFLVALLS